MFLCKALLAGVLCLTVWNCGQTGFRTQAIVGATLIDGANPPQPHSIVIIKDGIVSAMGRQQDVPIPPDSDKINGIGKFVAPLDPNGRITLGSPANLGVFASDPAVQQTPEKTMRAGKWIQ